MPFSGKEGENPFTTITKSLTIQCGVTKEASETWNSLTKCWNSVFRMAVSVLSSDLPHTSYFGNAKGNKSSWLYPQDWKVLAPCCRLATYSRSVLVPLKHWVCATLTLGVRNLETSVKIYWCFGIHNLNFMGCFHHLLKPLKRLLCVFMNVQATCYSSKCYFSF